MKISPSIASADILRIADEVQFTNQYFDDIHLDVADGIAVGEISFGIQMCRRICEIATLPISLHLEASDSPRSARLQSALRTAPASGGGCGRGHPASLSRRRTQCPKFQTAGGHG